MNNQLFEAALGIADPWYVQGVQFDAGKKSLTIGIDFVAGSRFGHPEAAGLHLVHDTQIKRYRHLNFFQHECYLEAIVPSELSPPDKWWWLDACEGAVSKMKTMLGRLKPTTSKGNFRFAIRYVQIQLALVQLPLLQRSLRGNGEHDGDGEVRSVPGDGSVTDGHRPATNDVDERGPEVRHNAGVGSSCFESDHREALRRSMSAIAAGKELLEMVGQDTQLDAETCMSLIGQSPDRKLTCRVLGLGGDSRAVAMSDNGLLDLREYGKFPECVASSSTFDVCFDDFLAFGNETGRARMTRLHTTGTAQGPLDALFLPRHDIEVIHGGCRNSFLLRLGAAAGLPVKAQVTVNVDPTTDRILSANVLRLLEPEAIVEGLRKLLIQLDLPFEEASGAVSS